MRKSSFGGRLSIAGNPARVLGGGVTKAKPKPKDKSRSLSSIGHSRTSSLSGAGSSRMSFLPTPARPSSGIGIRGRTDVPKDPRPVTDKKYIASCIKGLMEFLADNNYPHPTSQKLLTSPTSKDFFKIFTFMYSLIRPNYKQAAKMEDEVPRILKDLAYPFSFSKQYLYSVGSPHTWPHLLAALMWMIDLIKFTVTNTVGNINELIFQNSCNMDFSTEKPDNQIYFEYLEKTYIAYMKGDDEFRELDDELVQALKMAYEGDNIEAIENRCADMERELIRVSEEEAEIEKLKSEISKLDIDTQQANTFFQESDRYTAASEATINEKIEDIKKLDLELQAVVTNKEELQIIFENQDLSQADVVGLKEEQAQLRAGVEGLERQMEGVEKNLWEVMIETGKVKDKVEQEVSSYNRLAGELQLVPEGAALAHGHDFRLRTGFTANPAADFENTIKPKLKSLKNQYTDNTFKKGKEKFQLQCQNEKFEESLEEQRERLQKKEKELENIEVEIKGLKQSFQSDKRNVDDELEVFRQEIMTLEESRANQEGQLTKDKASLVAAKAELQKVKGEAKNQTNYFIETKLKIEASAKEFEEKLKCQVLARIENLKEAHSRESAELEQLKKESKERDARISEMIKSLEVNKK